MNTQPIVIVGGGHAGAQLCAALVEAGQGLRVHLVCEEPQLPYQRPPLSKSFLKSSAEIVQQHRADHWYADAGITLHRADPAIAVDRVRRRVQLKSGTELSYGQLVLATGTRARRLPTLPEDLHNVVVLRNATEAQILRERLATTKKLTILGGGFIGLEIAATARLLGLEVEILESAPRLLARSVSPEVADYVKGSHQAAGVSLRLGVRVGEFEIKESKLVALQVDHVRQPVELLVLGIGAVAETTLAHDAGLAIDNGIVVDGCMRTSDPAILAIGDCTNFPEVGSGRRLRLESVQNANDQARTAAATLRGFEQHYKAVPWFWSEQGSLRLQMVGLMPTDGVRHRRPGLNTSSFSMLHYQGDQLVCVESINASVDHMVARKLIEAGKSPAPENLCDATQPMKSFL